MLAMRPGTMILSPVQSSASRSFLTKRIVTDASFVISPLFVGKIGMMILKISQNYKENFRKILNNR